MATWTAERALDFAEMVAEWGVDITVGSTSKTGIKTPDVTDRTLMPASYLTDVRATFDLLRADWVTLGLGTRVQFTCGGIAYEVLRFRDDSADATVSFDGVKLK